MRRHRHMAANDAVARVDEIEPRNPQGLNGRADMVEFPVPRWKKQQAVIPLVARNQEPRQGIGKPMEIAFTPLIGDPQDPPIDSSRTLQEVVHCQKLHDRTPWPLVSQFWKRK